MAVHNIIVDVDFRDSAERVSTQSYVLSDQFDDAANAGAGNWDEVASWTDQLIDNLNILSMSAIDRYRVSIDYSVAGQSPNVAANNQVRAFHRMTTADTSQKASFEVPAWDDIVFDQDSNNLLSPAYVVAAGLVAALTRDPVTDELWAINWAQSRTRKSGIRLD